MKIHNKFTAGLVTVGMALGIGVPVAAAISGYGLTATPVTPYLFGSVYGSAKVSGTPAATVGVTLRLLKNGVQQGNTLTYTYSKGGSYNGTIDITRTCTPGTWVTQVKIASGAYASSAGKYIPCL